MKSKRPKKQRKTEEILGYRQKIHQGSNVRKRISERERITISDVKYPTAIQIKNVNNRIFILHYEDGNAMVI